MHATQAVLNLRQRAAGSESIRTNLHGTIPEMVHSDEHLSRNFSLAGSTSMSLPPLMKLDGTSTEQD